jgi:poly-gamma-glutamate synthesis protein (capsule biosynthesis protein)
MSDDSVISLLAGGDVQFDLVPKPIRTTFSTDEKIVPKGFDKVISKFKIKYYNLNIEYPQLFSKLCDILGEGFEKKHFKILNNGFSYKNKFLTQYIVGSNNYIKLPQKIDLNNDAITVLREAIRYNLTFNNLNEKKIFPFYGVKHLIDESHITFCNLECPISDEGIIRGNFCVEPIYAESLNYAGIDIVSVANNHTFDSGEKGFLDTLRNLDANSVIYVGGGININDARKIRYKVVKGVKFIFLAYSAVSDNGFYDDVAGEKKPGILPFSYPLIMEDIVNARQESDILVLSLHWGIANNPYVHNNAVEYAHKFIDAGVDIILGHHAHVSKGIEIYKRKPIFYSLGNFIFGYYFKNWTDNYLVKINIIEKKIDRIEIYPISGKEELLFQPVLLQEKEAAETIKHLNKISSVFGTKIIINGNRGVIKI